MMSYLWILLLGSLLAGGVRSQDEAALAEDAASPGSPTPKSEAAAPEPDANGGSAPAVEEVAPEEKEPEPAGEPIANPSPPAVVDSVPVVDPADNKDAAPTVPPETEDKEALPSGMDKPEEAAPTETGNKEAAPSGTEKPAETTPPETVKEDAVPPPSEKPEEAGPPATVKEDAVPPSTEKPSEAAPPVPENKEELPSGTAKPEEAAPPANNPESITTTAPEVPAPDVPAPEVVSETPKAEEKPATTEAPPAKEDSPKDAGPAAEKPTDPPADNKTTKKVNEEIVVPAVAEEPRISDPTDTGFSLEDALLDDGETDTSSRSGGSQIGSGLHVAEATGDANTDNKEAGSGTLAGVLSGIILAAVGSVGGYFTYQKKKLCFKNNQEPDAEAARKADPVEAQSDPQVLSNLLNSNQ